MDRDERRWERQLIRVNLEQLVNTVFGLAGRVPIRLLTKVVFVVLSSICRQSQFTVSIPQKGPPPELVVADR